MGAMLIYLIKSSLILSVAVALFMMLMRHETFHRINRLLLLTVALCSLLLPALNLEINTLVAHFTYTVEQMILSDYSAHDVVIDSVAPAQPDTVGSSVLASENSAAVGERTGISFVHCIIYIYLIGVSLLILRLMYMYAQIVYVLRKGCCVDVPSYCRGRLRLLLYDRDCMPFSWFGWVAISRTDLGECGREILTHEAAHVRRCHSCDILLADLIIILQWFNPMAWIMKGLFIDIHEYEADNAVLASGVSAQQYQLLIIKKAVGARRYSIANSFNHSLTKKRITMMCKEKSSLWRCTKGLYIVPLAVTALCVFSSSSLKCNASDGKVNENIANCEIAACGNSFVPEALVTARDTVRSYKVCEQLPEFPGGIKALMNYMRSNTKYPEESIDAGEMGKALVGFVVEKDGSITDVKLVKTSGHSRLDAEALRVVKSMPRWRPGKHKGEVVRVNFTQPVHFAIQKPKKKNKTTASLVITHKTDESSVFICHSSLNRDSTLAMRKLMRRDYFRALNEDKLCVAFVYSGIL